MKQIFLTSLIALSAMAGIAVLSGCTKDDAVNTQTDNTTTIAPTAPTSIAAEEVLDVPTPMPTQSDIIDTSDWQTYTNKYFSVKYPGSIFRINSDSGKLVSFLPKNINLQGFDGEDYDFELAISLIDTFENEFDRQANFDDIPKDVTVKDFTIGPHNARYIKLDSVGGGAKIAPSIHILDARNETIKASMGMLFPSEEIFNSFYEDILLKMADTFYFN